MNDIRYINSKDWHSLLRSDPAPHLGVRSHDVGIAGELFYNGKRVIVHDWFPIGTGFHDAPQLEFEAYVKQMHKRGIYLTRKCEELGVDVHKV